MSALNSVCIFNQPVLLQMKSWGFENISVWSCMSEASIPLQVCGTFVRRLSTLWRYNFGRNIKRNTNSIPNRSSAGPVCVFLWSAGADVMLPEAPFSFNVDQPPAESRGRQASPHNHHQVAVKAKLSGLLLKSTVSSTWQGATFFYQAQVMQG